MLSIALGMPQHLPPPGAIPGHPGDPARILFSLLLRVWGDAKRFCRNLAFLLILPKTAIEGEMAFGLAMVWVHPYQACISTMDEAAKTLTHSQLLAKIGPTPLCSSMKMPNMFPSLRRVTLVL